MTYLILLFAHLVADYPLQGDFLANMKGKNDLLMMTHCGIWTGCVCLAAHLCGIHVTGTMVAIQYAVHNFADVVKAQQILWCRNREPLGSALVIDQLIHAAQLLVFFV